MTSSYPAWVKTPPEPVTERDKALGVFAADELGTFNCNIRFSHNVLQASALGTLRTRELHSSSRTHSGRSGRVLTTDLIVMMMRVLSHGAGDSSGTSRGRNQRDRCSGAVHRGGDTSGEKTMRASLSRNGLSTTCKRAGASLGGAMARGGLLHRVRRELHRAGRKRGTTVGRP